MVTVCFPAWTFLFFLSKQGSLGCLLNVSIFGAATPHFNSKRGLFVSWEFMEESEKAHNGERNCHLYQNNIIFGNF